MRAASTVELVSAYRYECWYVPEINLVRSTGTVDLLVPRYRSSISTTYFQVPVLAYRHGCTKFSQHMYVYLLVLNLVGYADTAAKFSCCLCGFVTSTFSTTKFTRSIGVLKMSSGKNAHREIPYPIFIRSVF